MQEKCVKFNEKLTGAGRELEELEETEFLDMAAECGMNVLRPRAKTGGDETPRQKP